MSPSRRSRLLSILPAVLGLWVQLCPVGVRADTKDIFDHFSDWVVQLKVVEAGSGAKAMIGSGFVVSDAGHIVTNFHVIAELLHHPERYRVELVGSDSESIPARVLAFDVVSDVAVVQVDLSFDGHFEIRDAPLSKGVRVYSLGNPLDLGLSIVEGTYNGLLDHSRDPRIHFTGSLNPGMSGGPAILENGEVIGVNVATSGNQVSFLVPATRVRDLLDETRGEEFEPVEDYTEELRRQLLAYQDAYLGELEDQPFETVEMGPYTAPTRLAPHFNCWGDTTHDEKSLYEAVTHQCSTLDSVFVSERHNFSIVQLFHNQIETDELGTTRFYELYSNFFERNHSRMWGRTEEFTPFRCRTRFVESRGLTMKTAFCVRRYKKLEGIYDAVLKAAVLGRDDAGFETALVLSAVSFENAERLARRYLGAISWSE